MPLEQALCDTFRVGFYCDYLSNSSAAVAEDGVDLRVRFRPEFSCRPVCWWCGLGHGVRRPHQSMLLLAED